MIDACKVDQRRMLLGAIADDAATGIALKIHRDPQAVIDDRRHRRIRIRVHNRIERLQLVELLIGRRRIATHEPHLIQPRALLRQHAEGARHDFKVQLAAIALGHALELGTAVGNQPRKYVEPTGGTLGI